MDNLKEYREKVKQILAKYSQYKPSYGEVEIEEIFDIERDRYQLVSVGWNNPASYLWLHDAFRYKKQKNLDSAKYN